MRSKTKSHGPLASAIDPIRQLGVGAMQICTVCPPECYQNQAFRRDETIEGLVDPDLPDLRGPALRHGDRGGLPPAPRQQASQVGLVAVAANDVDSRSSNPPGQLEYQGPEVGGPAQRDRLVP